MQLRLGMSTALNTRTLQCCSYLSRLVLFPLKSELYFEKRLLLEHLRRIAQEWLGDQCRWAARQHLFYYFKSPI